MDTRLLRAFVTLAETANYREAASRLCISQPALTKQIKLLETQIGLILFERGRHGAVLTPHGSTLLPHANQVLSQVDDFYHHVVELNQQPPAILKVGFGISTFQEASFFVARLREKLLDVAIVLEDMPSHLMREKLYNHQLDIAFTRNDVQSSAAHLISHPLKTETLALAIAHGCPPKEYVRDYLVQYPLLMLREQRGQGLYQQIQHYLQSENITVTPLQEANDIQTLVALVAAKVGISLIPYSTKQISRETIDFIPILNNNAASWQIDVVWQTALPTTWKSIISTLIMDVHHKYTQ